MKVFYNIPYGDNPETNRLIDLIYENFSLKIQLACASCNEIQNSTGMLIIDQGKDGRPFMRYEGFTNEVEELIRDHIKTVKAFDMRVTYT